jgi:hypothetical protein
MALENVGRQRSITRTGVVLIVALSLGTSTGATMSKDLTARLTNAFDAVSAVIGLVGRAEGLPS